MRTTCVPFLAVMASSMLVKEAIAVPRHAHLNLHAKRDYYVATDTVIVTEEVWVTEAADGSLETRPATATAFVDESALMVAEPLPGAPPLAAPATTLVPVVSSSSSSSSLLNADLIEAKPSNSYVAPISTLVAAKPIASASASTSLAAPAATASSSSSTTSTSKRGLAYNDASLLTAFAKNSMFSWSYNWGSTQYGGTVPAGIEYVPMLWGLSSDHTRNWADAVSTGLAAGATHLLSFNEPDYSGQANLGYAAAATGYMTYMQPYASKAKLVSPAVTNGGDPMGLTWLTNFIAACSACTIDAIAVHWYNGGDAAAFKAYMAKAYAAGGNRPIWVTEFQASGTALEQAAFLKEVMAWMDSTSYIERYSYFMVADGNLMSGSALSSLGSTYAAAAAA
ncbi:uncharacterized protein L3040_004595 [Drepanopeziza brunnea f. sp. 'multigermtubi']|uniref:Asl1-like glycosyl hydrolase catalytic domain-containing protein n=1 Tax=Marssonina brunnea f. sp. multigermtubi (strain MB_m1) TaxID=1072389 RepID=K1X790_MARBU|nr:uncharacterized protein MBM_00089 [Drepanopeziza brunnea f. sp. 'multigermtubi' MB_m1]EKD20976.1 hypothetical protein MBM_00089 [Drepanopeziza brunnea f. sp. 'multigermtubi' MB_m1]KAJ5042035.1 hypothetical protein L3040_004595 [Drepanopeziza brunnea f. sp. 'multigermtubi']